MTKSLRIKRARQYKALWKSRVYKFTRYMDKQIENGWLNMTANLEKVTPGMERTIMTRYWDKKGQSWAGIGDLVQPWKNENIFKYSMGFEKNRSSC
jgi:hypothetical protein